MNSRLEKAIPSLATQAVKVVQELIENIGGAYLFGSAVEGGLCVDSDIDVLIATKQKISLEIRKKLVDRLMNISGKIGKQTFNDYGT